MARKKQVAQKQSSIKGKLLEMVVAGLHENPNVNVERNVLLPTLRSRKRKREIDILISGFFSGYPMRIAIECKNHKQPLDVEYIDAFIGKLNDIGIPTQHGIFVSPIGFTQGAIERAKEVGITPLLFEGLTADRLSEKIEAAIQSVVYLLAEITSLSIANNVSQTENPFQLWFLYDQKKNIQGAIPDFIWREWTEGTLPAQLGEYELELEIPDELQTLIDGKLEPITSVKAKVKIMGLVISVQGKVTEHILKNPTNQQVNKFKTSVSFDLSQKKYPVTSFSDEEGLVNFLTQRSEKVKLTIDRIRLPRIRFYSLYWPLSERAVRDFADLAIRCQTEGRKASIEELDRIEGNNLKTIWEPIWSKNPIIREWPSGK